VHLVAGKLQRHGQHLAAVLVILDEKDVQPTDRHFCSSGERAHWQPKVVRKSGR
jgi:hypothetical protein